MFNLTMAALSVLSTSFIMFRSVHKVKCFNLGLRIITFVKYLICWDLSLDIRLIFSMVIPMDALVADFSRVSFNQ